MEILASGRNDVNSPSENEYAVFDFSASYDISDRSTIYCRAINFTDERYSNEDTGGFMRYIGSPLAPGRFFQVGATYKF